MSGIDENGGWVCTQEAVPSYWDDASPDTIYNQRDQSSALVDRIVIAADQDIAPAARVAVDGRTDVVGGNLIIDSPYDFRFQSSDDDTYSVINRDIGTDSSQRAIVIGPDPNDRLGV